MTHFKYLEVTEAIDTFEESDGDFPTVLLTHSASEKFWTMFKITFLEAIFFFFITLIVEHKYCLLRQSPVSQISSILIPNLVFKFNLALSTGISL